MGGKQGKGGHFRGQGGWGPNGFPSTGAVGAQGWGLEASFSALSAVTNLTLIKPLPSASQSPTLAQEGRKQGCPV